jgi:hypothetical protein
MELVDLVNALLQIVLDLISFAFGLRELRAQLPVLVLAIKTLTFVQVRLVGFSLW